MRSLNYIINAKQIQISDECKKLIVSRAHGHMRDAHMLLDLYCLIGAEKFPEVVQSSVSIFARYFMSIYNKNKDLVLKCVEELSSFPMASLKSDFELFVFGLAKSVVGLDSGETEINSISKIFGMDSLKIVRVCMSDWVINSFSSEVLFKASFLAMFQLLSNQVGHSQGVTKSVSVQQMNVKH
jgi:hypothetical protein